MAAVAIGLLVLLPWGALRLARAVGCTPGGQRAAVAGVLVLTAASGQMHWVLSGFHANNTFFGSWPAMLAIVLGLALGCLGGALRQPSGGGRRRGPRGAVQCHRHTRGGRRLRSAPGHERRLLRPGHSLGRHCELRVTGRVRLVARAVHGWLARLVRWQAPLSDSWVYGDL